MSYPKVILYPDKLKHNTQTVYSWCRAAGIEPVFVGKCVCEYPPALRITAQCGFRIFADSREENLEAVTVPGQKMLLRIGMPDRAEQIVATADISLQSETAMLEALEKAGAAAGKIHKVILMVDLGDLREGLFFSDRTAIMNAAAFIHRAPHLELYGIGTNLTCYGSIVPDENNLGTLVRITRDVENVLGIKIPYIAGGNSSSLNLLLRGKMPDGINMLRIGEAILLGTDTATGNKFDELKDDAFILEAELVEVQTKPSFPVGERSVNAFGEVQEYEDKGMMRRGILAVGRQDVPTDGLIPVDRNIRIVGASSDHLIVDLTDAGDLRVGDTVSFKLTYGGLLACFTGKYIQKETAD